MTPGRDPLADDPADGVRMRVLKRRGDAADEFLDSVRRVVAGGSAIDRQVIAAMVRREVRDNRDSGGTDTALASLTPRRVEDAGALDTAPARRPPAGGADGIGYLLKRGGRVMNADRSSRRGGLPRTRTSTAGSSPSSATRVAGPPRPADVLEPPRPARLDRQEHHREGRRQPGRPSARWACPGGTTSGPIAVMRNIRRPQPGRPSAHRHDPGRSGRPRRPSPRRNIRRPLGRAPTPSTHRHGPARDA